MAARPNSAERIARLRREPEVLLAEPLQPTIGIEDFQKLDLRVARVIAAESAPLLGDRRALVITGRRLKLGEVLHPSSAAPSA